MKAGYLVLLFSLLLAGCNVSISTTPRQQPTPATPGTAEQRREALKAARSIIEAIDRGEFDAVWEDASGLLKDSTFKPVFSTLMSSIRGKLGQPSSRGETRVGFSRKIDPALPDGDYSVVEVDCDYGGTVVTEKVVMTRESGRWKLAGYFMSTERTIGG